MSRNLKIIMIILFLVITPSWALLGDLPVVNTCQGTSNINLNFSTAGTHQQIGLFLINSNDAAGFHVTFTFTNLGNFASGARQISITRLLLNKVSGTIGTGLTDPSDATITLNGSGAWVWHPGGVPTTETDSYFVEIVADWPDPSAGIAGFYKEKITCLVESTP